MDFVTILDTDKSPALRRSPRLLQNSGSKETTALADLTDNSLQNRKLKQQHEKAPSKIDLLDESDCSKLNIDGHLPVGDSVCAGQAPPKKVVAVVRPTSFTSSSTASKKLDQKHFVKMDGKEMVMEVKLIDENTKSSDKNGKPVLSQRLFPTTCKGISGLYIFSLGSNFPSLFKKAGTYNFYFSIENSIKCKKTVVVKPSSKASRWKVNDNLESSPCSVCVGSLLPPICIACFDEFENRIPFKSVPSLELELEATPGFHLKIEKFETKLINSGSFLKIENMLVETDGLDQIRPDYKATLEICSEDKQFSVLVHCKVYPGPLERVTVNNPQALENLLPDSNVENFIMEMFDGYNNHVAEGTEVLLHLVGYRIEDWMGVNRKVDSRGRIDLSGILKVTEGYGKSVSLSVMSSGQEIFRKESQIEERELRLLSELPESCVAGSSLPNLSFKVTDSFGSMDTNIHHDEKSGSFHTMRIESDASSIDNGIRYAFIYGSCKIPSLSLPENEGVVTFNVFHSRYPELHMNMKVQITSASTTNFGLEQTPTLGVEPIKDSSSARSSQIGLIDMFKEDLKEKLDRYEKERALADENLKNWKTKHEKAMEDLSLLQASLETLGSPYSEYLSNKVSIMKLIKEKHPDTAASVFCRLYSEVSPQPSLFLKRGVYGIVALLGSVASTSLSRVLSDYLGKEKMLAVVCTSSQFGPKSAGYLRFQSEAAGLGQSISNRFLVMCLDETRPWHNGLIQNDPQRRLAMDNPCLPNGDPIPGFIGYAVNLIDLSPEALSIKTKSGHGLRETLFYGVFRELQVYETGEHLEAALAHLNDGDAVSLDGVIAKENGFIYTRCSEPEIHFPITVEIKMGEAREKKRKAEEIIVAENDFLKKLEKQSKKATEKYQQFSAVDDY